jgi:hypothetical protein
MPKQVVPEDPSEDTKSLIDGISAGTDAIAVAEAMATTIVGADTNAQGLVRAPNPRRASTIKRLTTNSFFVTDDTSAFTTASLYSECLPHADENPHPVAGQLTAKMLLATPSNVSIAKNITKQNLFVGVKVSVSPKCSVRF